MNMLFGKVSGMGPVLAVAAAAAALAPSGRAQEAAAAPERVHVIGASVSGGFQDGPLFGAKTQGQSITLRKVLRAWCGSDVKVTTHPPMEMWNLYSDPLTIGKKEIALAKRRKADLVIAIDFPFWFSYGYVRGDQEAARMKMLEQGLALLAQLDVPMLIGDLPDMRGAATRMMNPRQVPPPATLKKLNERLAAFAAKHDSVTQVSLAGMVQELKVDGVVLPLADGDLRTKPGAMLQEDRLHATRLGMALLGFRLQPAMRAQFPKGHPLNAQQWTFEQFVEAARAEEELEVLQEAALQAAGGAGSASGGKK